MTTRKIGLVVGNGLTIDLWKRAARATPDWHPSRPLAFPIQLPTGDHFLSAFPEFRRALRNVSTRGSDFKRIVAAVDEEVRSAQVRSSGPDGTLAAVVEEARRFLAVGYSKLQLERLDAVLERRWQWTRWFKKYAPSVSMAVSFNYDLVVERLFESAGIAYGRIGIPDEHGVPLFKPHDSIDFGPKGVTASGPGPYLVFNNDFDQRRLSPAEMLGSRFECNLILPGERTRMEGLRRIDEGFATWASIAPSLSDCVFIGLSYWPVDRHEIDRLVEALSSSVRCYVVNPSRSPEFFSSLRRRGLDPIPCGGRPPQLGW